MLFPTAQSTYWLGIASSNSDGPAYSWLMGALPAPDAHEAGWDHWGQGQPSQQEGGQALCGMASALLAYDDAFGWASSACDVPMPYLCRINGELRCWLSRPSSVPDHG